MHRKVLAAALAALVSGAVAATPATAVPATTPTTSVTTTAPNVTGAPDGARAALRAHTGAPTVYDQDWDGDGHPDIIGADQEGILHLYRGNSTGTIVERVTLDHGWNTRDQIRVAGDWDRDGNLDVVARDPHTGVLYLYPGHGGGGIGGAGGHYVIGHGGWEIFTHVVAPGDIDGDGYPDLLAVRRSDTALLFYPGAGAAGHHAPRVVGSGWWSRDLLTTVGDWNHDGHGDMVARDILDGSLWLYFGDGNGGFIHSHRMAEGFDRFTALYGPGDFDGDGNVNLLARNQDGTLRGYVSNGRDGLLVSHNPDVGTGWNWILMNQPTQLPEQVITYSVQRLGSVQSDIDYFARRAEFTLGLPRGWAMNHSIRFDQVPSGGDFTLYLASPAQVEAAAPICSAQWSCRVGNGVYINDLRWRQPPSTFANHSLSDYRHYVFMHEVGHFLDLRHRGCPAPGRLAPVMQQQSISLEGCRANIWPLESELQEVRQNWL